MTEEIAVSIVCLTFNHGRYIRQTLEGFISQKTNFPYEVIIHDDASKDDTADIIREYAEKYPEIIRPILQKENQYSRKVNIHSTYVIPLIRGRYVALCEGDDYWTDPSKLQRQVDALDQNPGCFMSTHRVIEVLEDGTPNGVRFPGHALQSGVLSAKRFLELGKTYSFHTSSYFMRAEQYKKCKMDPPEFVKLCDVGDEAYMLFFAHCGDVFYIDETMSCYRRGVLGSWSLAQRQDTAKMVRHGHNMIRAFASFDRYTEGKYHHIMADRISRQMAITTLLEKNTYIFLKKENREYFSKLTAGKKVFILLSVVFPSLMRRVYLRRIGVLSHRRGVV